MSENNKVDLMTSKSSTMAESVEIEKDKLDDDAKSCVTSKDIKKVNLESIDLMVSMRYGYFSLYV